MEFDGSVYVRSNIISVLNAFSLPLYLCERSMFLLARNSGRCVRIGPKPFPSRSRSAHGGIESGGC